MKKKAQAQTTGQLRSKRAINALLLLVLVTGFLAYYNRYPQIIYTEYGFDREAVTEVGKQYIAERLQEIRNNPVYAERFF